MVGLVVHIGLPKTATTTLQKLVFPALKLRVPQLSYNEPSVVAACAKIHVVGLSGLEISQVKRKLAEHPNMLISYESLVGWNPSYWEAAAQTNLSLFGENATILITVRDPIECITSIYQQVIQEGRIVSPEMLFRKGLSGEDTGKEFISPALDFFDIEAFSYRRLADIYRNRFRSVQFLPVAGMASMSWLEPLFGLSKAVQDEMAAMFQQGRKFNQSYSQAAMNLTFAREKLLNSVGLSSKAAYGNTAAFWIEYYANEQAKMTTHREEDWLAFAQRKVRKALQWRRIMQTVVPRVFPHRKYRLPASFLRTIPTQCDNFDFLRQLAASEKQA